MICILGDDNCDQDLAKEQTDEVIYLIRIHSYGARWSSDEAVKGSAVGKFLNVWAILSHIGEEVMKFNGHFFGGWIPCCAEERGNV